MLACQMSQSEEGMVRIETMCVFIFPFFYIFYNHGYSLLLFYSVVKICFFAIEIEHTVYEYVGGLH